MKHHLCQLANGRRLLLTISLMLLVSLGSMGQSSFTLKGLVTDDEGKPLELASVSCKEQGKMTMTNLQGEYKMTLT